MKPAKKRKIMSDNNIVVAVYDTHEQAENAVRKLEQATFDMKKLSIVAKNPHAEEHVVGFYNTGDRVKHWGKRGAFWGSMWGLLFGSAFFAIPGLGPVLVAGPLVAWIVAALEGAVVVGGVSAVGAGLFSIGIPKDSVLEYEIALKTDRFLLLVDGTAEEAARAHQIIGTTQPATLQVHPFQHEDEYERELALARS
jgi:hypothetical protein